MIRFTNERVLRHLKTPFKELTRYGVLLRSFDLPLLKNVFPELLPESAALERFNQLIRHPYIESRGSYRYAFHELVHEALTEETQKEEPEAWRCYHKRALNYFTTVSPHSPDWYYHLLAYDEKQGLMEWQQAVQEARESGKREFIGALLQAALDKALKLSPAARAEIVYEQGRFNYYGVQYYTTTAMRSRYSTTSVKSIHFFRITLLKPLHSYHSNGHSGVFPNTQLALALAIPQTWHLVRLKFRYSDPLPSFPPTHYNVYVGLPHQTRNFLR